MSTSITTTLTVLGIESSCDETAAAIVRRAPDGTGRVLVDVIYSQVEEHAVFGGVVPEIAARAHVEIVDALIAEALEKAHLDFSDLDGVAATAGPGLIGGLIVGLMTAKAIAMVHSKPLIAVNHLEGHALTARLTQGLDFPYLLLLVSGGHTQLQIVRGVGSYDRLGTTIDDALGEAFDKTAKLLGLGYPGGPAVEKAARGGDAARFDLPRPMLGREAPHFSFAGLKTALRRRAEDVAPLDARDVADLCAAFEASVSETVSDRVRRAMTLTREKLGETAPRQLVIAGGVAANTSLRAALTGLAEREGFTCHMPPPAMCTDNGAMIAWAGAERLALGLTDPLDTAPRARWPLDENAEPAPGAGVKA